MSLPCVLGKLAGLTGRSVADDVAGSRPREIRAPRTKHQVQSMPSSGRSAAALQDNRLLCTEVHEGRRLRRSRGYGQIYGCKDSYGYCGRSSRATLRACDPVPNGAVGFVRLSSIRICQRLRSVHVVCRTGRCFWAIVRPVDGGRTAPMAV